MTGMMTAITRRCRIDIFQTRRWQAPMANGAAVQCQNWSINDRIITILVQKWSFSTIFVTLNRHNFCTLRRSWTVLVWTTYV